MFAGEVWKIQKAKLGGSEMFAGLPFPYIFQKKGGGDELIWGLHLNGGIQ